MTQVSLPFAKSNIEMDLENDVRESFDCEVEDFELKANDNESDSVKEPIRDLADNELTSDTIEDVAFLKGILSEEIFDKASAILQLDGSDDLDEPPAPKIPKLENPDPEGSSPRKDFSIAGLLLSQGQHEPQPSTSQMQPKHSPTPVLSSMQSVGPKEQSDVPRIPTMGGLGLPRTVTPSPLAGQMVSFPGSITPSAQPSVFIQHLSTPELATSFAETFQQTTGRTLQYVTSVNSLQDLPTFQTVQLNSPAFFQHIGTSFQSYMTPQFSYISPQSIIVSPQTGFIPPQLLSTFSAYPPTVSAPNQFLHPPPPSMSRIYGQHQADRLVINQQVPSTSSSFTTSSRSVHGSQQVQKKVARVPPQPWIRNSETGKPSPSSSMTTSSQACPQRLDPIKALSNMASHPMMTSSSPDSNPSRLSIVHGTDDFSRERNQQSLTDASGGIGDDVVFLSQTTSPSLKRARSELEKQRSVGTQAKLGGPLKIMTPRPWKGTDDSEPCRRIPLPLGSGNMSSGVSVQSSANSSLAGSRPSSTFSSSEIPKVPSPEITETASSKVLSSGIRWTKEKSATSRSNSIKVVMQRDSTRDTFKIEEVIIKEPVTSHASDIDPQTAIQALKVKAKVSRRARVKRDAAMFVPLDGDGQFCHTQDQFVNEMEVAGDAPADIVIKEEEVKLKFIKR